MKVADLAHAESLHHAYLVTGNTEASRAEVAALLQKRGVETAGNPDILSVSFSELLIDDTRDLILSFASLKPLGERKYVIASFSRANENAQNALLKAVEESLGHTVFFFCVEAEGHVLPTLKSRCVVVHGSLAVAEDTEDAEAFLSAGYEERLKIAERMASAASKTQDRAPARALAASLISVLKSRTAGASALRDALDAHRYLRMAGGSVKAVLSHLAVALPKK